MEWVFSFLCIFGFYGMKCFTVAGVQILPPTSEKCKPTAGHQQTQSGTRYGWQLAHKERLPFVTP